MEITLAGLNATRAGEGPPMLLLHGIGHRWQVWTPVLGSLARDFDVVAVDLPGFGCSPPFPADRPASFEAGVAWLEEVLDELGWERAHLVGNSLGGWLTLELAVRRRALSVSALAPAGLWDDPDAMHRRLHRWFRLWVDGSRRLGWALGLLRYRFVRTLVLAGLFGRPWRVPADIAIGDARNLATCAFQETYEAGLGLRFTGGRDIDVPVTVAWCSRDRLFPPGHYTLAELPASTQVEVLRGCGHVPTWDDPPLVLETIRATVARARPVGRPGRPGGRPQLVIPAPTGQAGPAGPPVRPPGGEAVPPAG